MKTPTAVRKTGEILLTTLFWLMAQATILFMMLLILPLFLPHSMYGGFHGAAVGQAFIVGYAAVAVIYTLCGSCIMAFCKINSKSWWISMGVCFVVYFAVTIIGALLTVGQPYIYDALEGVAILWFGALLWLGEIELVHFYWQGQRRKYLGNSEK